jgi:type III secretion system YscQ/HrcQ family protein
MAKNPDENFDMPGFETGSDPFGGGEGGQDFFDSGEAPLMDESPQPPVTNPSGPPTAQAPLPRQGGVDRKVVNLTADIPIQIVAVLGKKSVTVKDIVSLRMGQVIELNRLPNEAIDLVANGKLIAKGELVEIDGRLGIRILKIFD